ncbi:MAG: PKD domain-containing protein [Gemmatimonadetes bacterium]|nr:PKD domain-containing protein [Gemmatimonadota bacterium]
MPHAVVYRLLRAGCFGLVVLVMATIQACSSSSGGPSAPLTANAAPTLVRVSPSETSLQREVGQAIAFEIEGTDPDGSPLTFEFLLDGDRASTSSRFSFTPDSAGTHEVTVRVSDGVNVVTRRWTITVAPDVPRPPVATVVVSPDSGSAPLQVTITVTASDEDGAVARYQVDSQADGTFEYDGATPPPAPGLTATFPAAGTYRVRARVTDDEGLTAIVERSVRVSANRPPQASLTVAPAEGLAPLAVRVNGAGTDAEGGIALYELDLDGDGGYELAQAAPFDTTIVFDDYTRAVDLVLRVTDAAGQTDVDRATVRPLPDVDESASTLRQSGTERLPSDGRSVRRIIVRIVDPTGRPLRGVTVELASSRNGGPMGTVDVISPAAATTNAAGEVEANFSTNSSSTLLGDAVVTARAAGETLAASITIQFVTPVNTARSSIRCPFTAVHVVGSRSTPRQADVLATIRDATGNPLPGIFVEFRTRDPAIWPVMPASGRTNGAGQFGGVVTSARPNDSTFVDVYADGHKTGAICIVSFLP